jgi:hypothetical protein
VGALQVLGEDAGVGLAPARAGADAHSPEFGRVPRRPYHVRVSFGFTPFGQGGETSIDLTRQYSDDRHHPPSAAALAARSQHGRGHLLVSEGLVSFNSAKRDEVVHVGDILPVTHSLLASQLVLETAKGPLEVSVSRRHRRRLIEMLRSAQVHVTSPSG